MIVMLCGIGDKDAHSGLVLTDDDGYLYYRWRVELAPTTGSVDEGHQVALARSLTAPFEDVGGADRRAGELGGPPVA
jgi:hypothetical protein